MVNGRGTHWHPEAACYSLSLNGSVGDVADQPRSDPVDPVFPKDLVLPFILDASQARGAIAASGTIHVCLRQISAFISAYALPSQPNEGDGWSR